MIAFVLPLRPEAAPTVRAFALVPPARLDANAAALLRAVPDLLTRSPRPIYLTDGRRQASPNAIGRWYRRARGFFFRPCP